MTASTWNVPASYKPLSGTNIAGRVVAVGIMLFGGLVLAAGAFGVSVALDMVTRGSVVANTADLASLRAVQPVVPLIAIFGLAHVVAAVGTVLGARWALQLALGIAAVDAVAGVLLMFGNALTEKPALDGAGIGVTILILGTILFAAVRAAEYDPSTDPAAA